MIRFEDITPSGESRATAPTDEAAIDLGALNEAVRAAQSRIAWYLAACFRDGSEPTPRDLQELRADCEQLDRLQAKAQALLGRRPEATS